MKVAAQGGEASMKHPRSNNNLASLDKTYHKAVYSDIMEKNTRSRRIAALVPAIISDYTSGLSSGYISRTRDVNVATVLSVLRQAGVEIRTNRSDYQRFRYEESVFDTIDTELKAYFLGLLYADGSIDKEEKDIRITLQEMDGYILTPLSQMLAYGRDLTRPFEKDEFRGRMLSVTSKRLAAALITHGCTPAKSMTIRLPRLDPSLMRHFLRGYFDGDGCFSYSKPKARRSVRGIFKIVSNTTFCEDLQRFLSDNLGIYIGVYHPSSNPQVGALQCGNDKTVRILHRYMYDGATIYLSRKRDKIESYLALKP